MNNKIDKTRYHILLVEDNEHDVIAVQNALDTGDVRFELTHFWQAEDVLEQFAPLHSSQVNDIDLIMSDHHLPGISGLEFCQMLLDNNIETPLILLTGAGAETLAVQALKMGVSDYLVKDLNQGYLELLPVILPEVIQRFKERQALNLAQEQLRDYAAELQMRNEELHAFAQMVAHDLKTPINTMLNAAEMLCDYRSFPQSGQTGDSPNQGLQSQENLLEIIERSGYKAANIVDDLLVLATIRQNEIVQVPLNMQEIVQSALDNLSNLIEKYQATITLPKRWPVALGNSSWVEQVWVNYLSNGIKYGGNLPHLELGARERENGMISFWVRDNGPGLLEEDIQQLFRPFIQLVSARSSSSQVEGHGLGLSIVKRIIEKLGGEVGVEGHANAKDGSTFYFTLPSGLRT